MVARIREKRNAFKVWGNPFLGKSLTGVPRRRWKDFIQMGP
jgi:hypothetical protein